MKTTLRLLSATLLSVLSLSAFAETATATVTHVEDRKVLNTRAYATTEDAVHALTDSSKGNAVRVGTGVAMSTIYIVRAKTAQGKHIELTAQSAPEVGAMVTYDVQSKQVQR